MAATESQADTGIAADRGTEAGIGTGTGQRIGTRRERRASTVRNLEVLPGAGCGSAAVTRPTK